jgi:hypothetical protein
MFARSTPHISCTICQLTSSEKHEERVQNKCKKFYLSAVEKKDEIV